MKTAMQELIEKIEHTKVNNCKHLYEVVFFDGVLAIIEGGDFLEKEKIQTKNTYESGFKDGYTEAIINTKKL